MVLPLCIFTETDDDEEEDQGETPHDGEREDGQLSDVAEDTALLAQRARDQLAQFAGTSTSNQNPGRHTNENSRRSLQNEVAVIGEVQTDKEPAKKQKKAKSSR